MVYWLSAAAFELAVLAASYSIAGCVATPREFGARVYLTLLVRAALVAIMAGAFTILGLNFPSTYLVSGALCAALALALTLRRSREHRRSGRPGGIATEWALGRAAWAMAALGASLFVPVFWATASAPVDIDSWGAFEAVIDWAANQRSVLDFVWHYPGTWELQYVPIVTLQGWAEMAWVPAACATAAIPFLTFELARRCGLPSTLAVAMAFGSISFYFFWTGPSGVWTFKNDMLAAAAALGLPLATLRIRDHGLTLFNGLLVSLSASLLLIKYSGAPLLVVLLGLSLVHLASNRAITWRQVAVLAVAGLAVSLLTTLPYYLENWIVERNPVFPMKVSLAFLELPGRQELGGTSILSHMGDPTVLRILLGIDPVPNRAGLLFGLVWPLGWALAGGVGVHRLLRREPLRDRDLVLLAGAAAIFLYFASFWSAGFTPDDLIFLRYNNPSLRYATAALVLCELGIVAWFWKLGPRARVVVAAALALQLGSRVWMFYFQFPRGPTLIRAFPVVELLALMLLGALLTLAVLAIARSAGERWALGAITVVLGLVGSTLVSHRLPEIGRRLDKYGVEFLLRTLEESPPGPVTLIAAAERCTFYSYRYPLYVNQHIPAVHVTRTRDEYSRLASGHGRPAPYVAIYWEDLRLCPAFPKIRSALSRQGYDVLAESVQSILWHRRSLRDQLDSPEWRSGR